MPFGTARSSAGDEEDVEELSSWSLLLRRWSQVPSLYDLPLEISSSERRQMELRGRRGSCLGRVERLVARKSDRYAAGSSRRVSTGSLLEGFARSQLQGKKTLMEDESARPSPKVKEDDIKDHVSAPRGEQKLPNAARTMAVQDAAPVVVVSSVAAAVAANTLGDELRKEADEDSSGSVVKGDFCIARAENLAANLTATPSEEQQQPYNVTKAILIDDEFHCLRQEKMQWLKKAKCNSFRACSGAGEEQIRKISDVSMLLYYNVLPHLTWIYLLCVLYLPHPYKALVASLQLIPFVEKIPLAFVGGGIASSSSSSSTISGTAPDANNPPSKFLQYLSHKLPLKILHHSNAAAREEKTEPFRRATPQTIYGFHPHGKYPISIFPLLCRSSHRPTVCQSSLGPLVPSVSLISTAYRNASSCSRKNMLRLLREGKSIGLFPGGVKEMILCRPGSNKICIVKVRGRQQTSFRLRCGLAVGD